MTELELERAAEIIRAGGLVGFPTETVYGLGANALDEVAVGRIFETKGRPATSPLIVHVASVGMARSLAREWPDAAEKLAARFWPGPLTLIVLKTGLIPDRVTAGRDTVGLRLPDHPVARRLIELAGVPVAGPSANPFTFLSPTTAGHVRRSLPGVDLVLEGGPSRVGIESTVLDVTRTPAVLLRLGMITREAIEAVIGPVEVLAAGPAAGEAHAAPGLHARHYSPRTPLVLVGGPDGLPGSGRGAYLHLTRGATGVACRAMPNEPDEYASILYAKLHELDDSGFDWIAVELPPEFPSWSAVRDRLNRAAKPASG